MHLGVHMGDGGDGEPCWAGASHRLLVSVIVGGLVAGTDGIRSIAHSAAAVLAVADGRLRHLYG